MKYILLKVFIKILFYKLFLKKSKFIGIAKICSYILFIQRVPR